MFLKQTFQRQLDYRDTIILVVLLLPSTAVFNIVAVALITQLASCFANIIKETC